MISRGTGLIIATQNMHTENKNPLRGTKQGEPFSKFTKDKINSRNNFAEPRYPLWLRDYSLFSAA